MEKNIKNIHTRAGQRKVNRTRRGKEMNSNSKIEGRRKDMEEKTHIGRGRKGIYLDLKHRNEMTI